MNTPAQTLDLLRNKPLFSEFSDSELEQFLGLGDPEHFTEGQWIVRQESSGDCMYVVVSGHASVVHHKDGYSFDLAVLKPGDFFGELALVDSGPRSADVISLDSSTLLKVSKAGLAALSGVYPTVAFKFLIAIGRILVERLRKSNQRYVDSLLVPLPPKNVG
jgi:CRP-like cAMP-binding protein